MIQAAAATGNADEVYHPLRYAVEREEALSCLLPWAPEWDNPRAPDPEEMAFVFDRFRDYCAGDRDLARRELALLFRIQRWHRYRLAVMPEPTHFERWLRDGPENINAADLPESPTVRYVEVPPSRAGGLHIRDFLLEGVYAELQTRPGEVAEATVLQASAVWYRPGLRGERLTFTDLRDLPDFHLEVRFSTPETRLVRALTEGLSSNTGEVAFTQAPEVRNAVLTLAICGLLETAFEV